MGKLLLFLILGSTAVVSLVRPWIGVMTYYTLALLGPQYIWWWNFEGLRVSFVVAAFALVGVAIKLFQKQFNFSFLKTKLNLYVFLLWLFITISYYFGPYVADPEFKNFDPDKLFSNANKIFLFYFCATLAMNDLKKLRYFSIIFIISTVYFIYWANTQYFSGTWSQFNMGRLMGPADINGASIYRDENAFAMLFVTGLPFVYYMRGIVEKKWLRYALWAVIPLGWHAVFLTGSRGGLLGLGVITFLSVLYSRRKALAFLLIPLFLFFYIWQAGDVMKQRSETISEYKGETSAQMRLTAWKGALKMIETYPITGVGLGSFITALPHLIESTPRVAHNTFFQFAGESGIGAGLGYLMMIIVFFINSGRIRRWSKDKEADDDIAWIKYFNNASTISFAGLTICSIFLSLNFYEIFFYLLIFNNFLSVFCLRPAMQTVVSI